MCAVYFAKINSFEGMYNTLCSAMLCRLQKKTSGTTAEETDSMTTFISELKVLLEEAEAIDNITTMEDKIRAIKAQFMCIFKTTLLGRP